MHLSVEGLRPWDWSYPVLQYLREWPTPTVIIFDMSTVVKPQQPPPPPIYYIFIADYSAPHLQYNLLNLLHNKMLFNPKYKLNLNTVV